MKIAGSLLALFTVSAPLIAQQATYDVATIKLTAAYSGIQEFQMRPGGRLVIAGMTLRDLVRRAYGFDTIQTAGQVVGGPGWAGEDRFDVQAATDSDVDTNPQERPSRMLAMLRTLLEQRFKLKVRAETRETDAYTLVVSDRNGKLGRDLHPSTIDCPIFIPGAPRPPPDPVRWCGFRGPRNGILTAQGVTMKELSTMFAGFMSVGRPVIDKTRLTGRFDFHIPFEPGFVPGPNPSAPLVPNPAADSGPNLFTAVEEELGLKLRRERAPVGFLVIDDAVRPMEN